MVQHLQFWDYISLGSKIQPGQFIEYVADDENQLFTTTLNIRNAHYIPPEVSIYKLVDKEPACLYE